MPDPHRARLVSWNVTLKARIGVASSRSKTTGTVTHGLTIERQPEAWAEISSAANAAVMVSEVSSSEEPTARSGWIMTLSRREWNARDFETKGVPGPTRARRDTSRLPVGTACRHGRSPTRRRTSASLMYRGPVFLLGKEGGGASPGEGQSSAPAD